MRRLGSAPGRALECRDTPPKLRWEMGSAPWGSRESHPAGGVQVVVAVRGVLRRVGTPARCFQSCRGHGCRLLDALPWKRGGKEPLPALTWVSGELGALRGGLSVVVVPSVAPRPRRRAGAVERHWERQQDWDFGVGTAPWREQTHPGKGLSKTGPCLLQARISWMSYIPKGKQIQGPCARIQGGTACPDPKSTARNSKSHSQPRRELLLTRLVDSRGADPLALLLLGD